MALIMLERKVELLQGGKEKKVYEVGEAAPAKWAGKPFVGDGKVKKAEA